MELLSHGAMVERFERKKMAVKSKLNDLVDDLFAFMLSEVTTTTKTPPPPVLHPVMATSGGATITIVVPSTSTTSTTSTTSSIPQQPPPTTTNQNKSSSAPVVVPPSGSGTISTASISANKNPAIGNGLQMGSYTIKSIKKIPTFTMLKPVSKPAAAHVAMKVKEEMCNEGEEEEEDDEEDEYDDDDEKAEIGQHHQTNIWSLTSFGALSNQPSGTTAQQGRSSALLQSSSQGSSGLNHPNHDSSNHQRHHQHHHNNHHHHHHSHHPGPHGSGFCDSDDESCECYDCMDESMVKVEMENDDDENDEDDNNEEGDYSDSDNLGKHFFATSEGPKRKRQRMFEDRRARDKEEVKEEIDGSGIGGPSDPTENMEDLEEESESVSNNHQIDTVGLKCWFGECQAMLEDRAKLNQHLFFEHEKTLPYQCRVVGCGRQFDVRKDFWQHIRNGHADYTCSICSIKFNGYFPFITHEFQQHEEGIFRCSRVGCDFVAAIRDLVYKHAKTEHVKFVCTFAGCDATFECYSYLKRHRRIHSQVKPYCCKWPGCGYSSTQCGAVIQHIRIRHFRLPSSVKKQRELNIIDQRNPNDYLEVITELLN